MSSFYTSPELVRNKLQYASCSPFAEWIGFAAERTLGRVRAGLQIRGKHHRAWIMQTATVAMI